MLTRTPRFRKLTSAPFIAASLLAATMALFACGDNGPSTDKPRDADSAAAPSKSARDKAIADSIAKRQASSSTIDSAMLAPPPPLTPAPEPLSADSIPLRAPNGEPARYGLRSGLLVQRFTGNSRGERRTIFDHYGMWERREENSAPYPAGTKGGINNLIVITSPEEMAYADVRTKRGFRTPNEGLKRYLEMGASKTKSLGEMIIEQSGAERLPDTTIAGYRCRVLRKNVKGMTVTDWIWRGLVIREHIYSPQDSVEVTLEPIEIKADIDVPDSTFKFPAGYKIDLYTPPSGGKK